MNKVYIAIAFDGEHNGILEVFKSKTKAEEYVREYEEQQLNEMEFKYDTCSVKEYNIVK